MEISYRLNVSGPGPSRGSLLPGLPGAERYEPSSLARAGEQVRSSLPLVAVGSVAGVVLGTKLLRMGGGGIFRGIVGGIAGVLAGATLTAAGLAAARGIGSHREPARPDGAKTADPTVHERERVKVMTYNVHGGMGGPGEFGSSEEELDQLADVIRREQPDVLLLQEVDSFATRSDHTDVLRELDERLGADSAVGATAMTQVTGRNQDVSVMTFNGFKVEDARNIVHPDMRGGGIGVRFSSAVDDAKKMLNAKLGTEFETGARYHARNTIDAIVRTPAGNSVRVLSGHYEWPSKETDHQARQVGSVAGALDAWDGPTIWGADFNVKANSEWGESERRILGDAGLRDTFGDAPFEEQVSMTDVSRNPQESTTRGGGIDRIYASEHATPIETRVVGEAGDASDHLPVVTELELVPDA